MLWPQVHAKLLDLWSASATSVSDGAPLTADSNKDFIAVGYDGEDAQVGSFTVDRSSFGNTILSESGTVVCLIVAQSGSTKPGPLRVRAFEIADDLTALLSEDHTLGGLVGQTAIEIAVLSDQNERGAAHRLLLSVTYTSLT